jgi:hypothetical protein
MLVLRRKERMDPLRRDADGVEILICHDDIVCDSKI